MKISEDGKSMKMDPEELDAVMRAGTRCLGIAYSLTVAQSKGDPDIWNQLSAQAIVLAVSLLVSPNEDMLESFIGEIRDACQRVPREHREALARQSVHEVMQLHKLAVKITNDAPLPAPPKAQA